MWFRRKVELLIFALVVGGYALFPMKLGVGTGMIGVGVLIWLLYEDFLGKFKELFSDNLSVIFVAIVILAFFGIFYGAGSWDNGGERTFNRYSKFFVSAFIIFLMKDKRVRDFSINAFVCGVGFIVFSMCLNVFFNLPWSVTQNLGWGHDHTVVGDYITQNLMVCLFIIICLDKCIADDQRKWKIWFGFLVFIGVFSVYFLSPSRTGYVLVFGSLVLYIFFKLESKLKWFLPLVLFLGAALVYQSNSFVQKRVDLAVYESKKMIDQMDSGVSPDITSIGARIYMWSNTWELVKQKPIFGWGLGGYKEKWCDQVPDENWCDFADTHPHNQYLMFWVELGIAGLLIFLSMIAWMVYFAWRAGGAGAVLVAFVGFFAIDSLFNSPLWVNREYQFFLLMLPLVYSVVKYKNKE